MTATLEHKRWLAGDDHGSSSETIWAVMTDERPVRGNWHPDRPYDGDDFGRCYRLLKRFPEWAPRLHEVATAYPEWSPIVAAWDELSRLYEAQKWDALYRRLRECRAQRCLCGKYPIEEAASVPNVRHSENACGMKKL